MIGLIRPRGRRRARFRAGHRERRPRRGARSPMSGYASDQSNQAARGAGAPGRTYSAGTGDAMAQPAEFVIGADATCSDGPCGQVTRVVVNPVAEAVTHLVVEPKHPRGLSRLVPLDLVEGGPREVRLRCTRAEVGQLDSAEESHFSPELGGYSAYGPGEVLTWPYYGLGGGAGFGVGTGVDGPSVITEDAVPPGE